MKDEIDLAALLATPKGRAIARKRKHEEPKDLKLDDLDMRKSIFDGRYPGSKEEDWVNHEGLGWVHKLEEESFAMNCAKCPITGKVDWKHNMAATDEGSFISKEEAKKNWIYCEYTELWFRKENAVSVRDSAGVAILVSKKHKEGNFFKCDYSGDYYPTQNKIRISSSPAYKCVAGRFAKGNPFHTCQSCMKYFEKAMVHDRPDIGSRVCDPCYAKIALKGIIHKHDYAVYPQPLVAERKRMGHKLKDGVVFATNKQEIYKDIRLFGVEVETEMSMAGCKRDGLTRHVVATQIIKTLGNDFVICKEDGTLTMNGKYSGGELDPNGTGPTYAGFEAVSAPADIETHRERWPRLEKMDCYRHLRAWDTDTCGLHIHVTREALTYLQIARMLLFVNNKNNTLFIQKIAGRGSAKFCRYVEKEPADALRIDPRTDENRRQAINLCNEKTVEFRIFRGTVNPKHIMRNIEFCDAICDFCHPGSRSLQEMKDYLYFVKFVDQNRKRWKLLAAWFAKHDLLKVKLVSKKANRGLLTLKVDDVVEPEIKVDEAVVKPPKKLAIVAAAHDDDGDDV